MDAEYFLTRRLIKWSELDQTDPRPATSFYLAASSPTTKEMTDYSPRENGSRELRSIVEQRFLRMNEAHDRIRVKLLGSEAPRTS